LTCEVAPALARKATRGEAAAVAFVVDDLLGWLIGRLADAGYRKLTTLVLGSPEERALKEAVTAAVQATVGEIDPSDGEEAERVAERRAACPPGLRNGPGTPELAPLTGQARLG